MRNLPASDDSFLLVYGLVLFVSVSNNDSFSSGVSDAIVPAPVRGIDADGNEGGGSEDNEGSEDSDVNPVDDVAGTIIGDAAIIFLFCCRFLF